MIFMVFQFLEINEKKFLIYNENEKKKIVFFFSRKKNLDAYCTICIVTVWAQ